MTQREAEILVEALLDDHAQYFDTDMDGDVIEAMSESQRARYIHDWAERIRREAGLTEFRRAVAAIPRSEGDVA